MDLFEASCSLEMVFLSTFLVFPEGFSLFRGEVTTKLAGACSEASREDLWSTKDDNKPALGTTSDAAPYFFLFLVGFAVLALFLLPASIFGFIRQY